MSEHNLVVRVIRKLTGDDYCPDGRTCPAILDVSSRPGHKAIVGKVVTSPAEAAALGVHIGPGESVVIVPDELLDGR